MQAQRCRFTSITSINLIKALVYHTRIAVCCLMMRENSLSCHFVFVFQLLSHVQLFVFPWTAACWTSLSSTMSQGLLKFMSTESVMPCNHLTLCLLLVLLVLLPSIFPSIRVFSSVDFIPFEKLNDEAKLSESGLVNM